MSATRYNACHLAQYKINWRHKNTHSHGLAGLKVMRLLGSTLLLALACIDVEEVVSSHAWFAWHASRDDNKVAVVQSIWQLIWPKMASHLCRTTDFYSPLHCGPCHARCSCSLHTLNYLGLGVHVRHICSYARCTNNVIKAQFPNVWHPAFVSISCVPSVALIVQTANNSWPCAPTCAVLDLHLE